MMQHDPDKVVALDSAPSAQPTPTLTQCFSYSLLEGNIHCLTVHLPNAESVEDFMRMQYFIYDNLESPTNTMRQLLDVTNGLPPIARVMDHFRAYIKTHPRRPPSRTAILLADSALIKSIDAFVRLMLNSKEKVRIFNKDGREAALQWLRES
jgi:hypothetical protein